MVDGNMTNGLKDLLFLMHKFGVNADIFYNRAENIYQLIVEDSDFCKEVICDYINANGFDSILLFGKLYIWEKQQNKEYKFHDWLEPEKTPEENFVEKYMIFSPCDYPQMFREEFKDIVKIIMDRTLKIQSA